MSSAKPNEALLAKLGEAAKKNAPKSAGQIATSIETTDNTPGDSSDNAVAGPLHRYKLEVAAKQAKAMQQDGEQDIAPSGTLDTASETDAYQPSSIREIGSSAATIDDAPDAEIYDDPFGRRRRGAVGVTGVLAAVALVAAVKLNNGPAGIYAAPTNQFQPTPAAIDDAAEIDIADPITKIGDAISDSDRLLIESGVAADEPSDISGSGPYLVSPSIAGEPEPVASTIQASPSKIIIEPAGIIADETASKPNINSTPSLKAIARSAPQTMVQTIGTHEAGKNYFVLISTRNKAEAERFAAKAREAGVPCNVSGSLPGYSEDGFFSVVAHRGFNLPSEREDFAEAFDWLRDMGFSPAAYKWRN